MITVVAHKAASLILSGSSQRSLSRLASQNSSTHQLVNAGDRSSLTPLYRSPNVTRSHFKRRGLLTMAVAAADARTVLVPIAQGSEEIEAVAIIDVLRRAGAKVTVASVEDQLEVACSRGVKLVGDVYIRDVADQTFDAIAIPGGMPGAERLRDDPHLKQLLAQQAASDRLVTAICASPAVVLEPQGLLKGKKATSHPAFVDRLTDKSEAESRVVADGQVITSRGPGTAIEFSLALVKALFGAEKAREVAGPMVMPDGLQI